MATKAKERATKPDKPTRTPRSRRPNFEQLLLDISTDFVRALAPAVDSKIRRWLAPLGAHLDLDGISFYGCPTRPPLRPLINGGGAAPSKLPSRMPG
jgi:hypothetical protein